MNVGELRVHIENNAVRLHLTHADIEDLETFNAMVFGQLLKLMKPFVMVDKDNRENSYFVVPTCLGKAVSSEVRDLLSEGSVLQSHDLGLWGIHTLKSHPGVVWYYLFSCLPFSYFLSPVFLFSFSLLSCLLNLPSSSLL
jgi:hypothetical protein